MEQYFTEEMGRNIYLFPDTVHVDRYIYKVKVISKPYKTKFVKTECRRQYYGK